LEFVEEFFIIIVIIIQTTSTRSFHFLVVRFLVIIMAFASLRTPKQDKGVAEDSGRFLDPKRNVERTISNERMDQNDSIHHNSIEQLVE
jgi:hypothetical protein